MSYINFQCPVCCGSGYGADGLPCAYSDDHAIAPPVAAGSVDTSEFDLLLAYLRGEGSNDVKAVQRGRLIAHIDAWGAQQREAGWQEGKASNETLLRASVNEMDAMERERAEKVEAELKQVNEWRAAALASNQQMQELMAAKLAAAEARVKELEDALKILKT